MILSRTVGDLGISSIHPSITWITPHNHPYFFKFDKTYDKTRTSINQQSKSFSDGCDERFSMFAHQHECKTGFGLWKCRSVVCSSFLILNHLDWFRTRKWLSNSYFLLVHLSQGSDNTNSIHILAAGIISTDSVAWSGWWFTLKSHWEFSTGIHKYLCESRVNLICIHTSFYCTYCSKQPRRWKEEMRECWTNSTYCFQIPTYDVSLQALEQTWKDVNRNMA